MLKSLSRPLKYAIMFLEGLIVLLTFLLLYNFFLPLGKESHLVYFDDSNATKVFQTLKENGYNITDWDHYLLPENSLPKKGWYRIGHTDEGRYHFFRSLNSHPVQTMKIRIFSGETHTEMLRRLASDMKLDEKKLQYLYEKKSRYKEADIFAGIYSVAREAKESETLDFLFKRSDVLLEDFKKNHFTYTPDDYTVRLLLTIASIIQKESNKPEEMPLISSVIYNRLEKGMKLQMDGTLNYGNFSHCIITPERIKSDNSFYNTYKYKGLPPAPLSTVSLKALHAAMFPAETDYLFFMLTPDGSHHFSATYKEHLAYLKAFRKYQRSRKKAVCEAESNTTSE